jgi:hypothetical protein
MRLFYCEFITTLFQETNSILCSVDRAYGYHHHKHPGLGHLACSVSRVTVALSIVSSVSQLFSFLVGCTGMILKGFGFVAFFAGVKASSVCIHLSCLVCSLSVVRGEWSRLFCGHKGRNLSEVSITSFLPPQAYIYKSCKGPT